MCVAEKTMEGLKICESIDEFLTHQNVGGPQTCEINIL